MIKDIADWSEAIDILLSGQLAVIPTDTIYGLAARALDPTAIARLDAAKGRAGDNPYIILIAALDDLRQFDIVPDKKTTALLNRIWSPAQTEAVSIVLPCSSPSLEYLHRGRNLAFRCP